MLYVYYKLLKGNLLFIHEKLVLYVDIYNQALSF